MGNNKFKIIYDKNDYITVKLNLDNFDETEFIKALEFVHSTDIWQRENTEDSMEDTYISWSPYWPIVDDLDKKYKLYPPSIDNLSFTNYSRY